VTSSADPSPPEKDVQTQRSSGFSTLDALVMGVITLAAGFLRIFQVADPRRMMFDEVYYAKDACYYARASLEACRMEDLNEVHPPLGKWIISLGIKLFGFDSFGYRSMAVLAGTITVALVYLLARKILRSTVGAGVAAGLLAIDPLHFVQSRISMIDVFVPLFAIAAFLFLAFDRDNSIRLRDAIAATVPGGETPGGSLRAGLVRPWRAAAGVAAGAAVACKWTGAFVPVAVVALAVTWAISSRKRLGKRKAFAAALRSDGLGILLFLVVLPIAVYCASYIGRGIEGELLALPWSEGSWWRAFFDKQWQMLDFHRSLDATHPYQSPAWSWMLLKRPVSYFFETDPNGDYREVLATGSPFVWWSAIFAMLYIAYTWIRSRSLRRPEGIILAGFVFSYAIWLIPTSSRSAIFVFYFVATVPFICLAIGYVASVLGSVWEARTAVAVFCVTAIGFFAFYYPLLTKQALSREQWDRRIWFFDNCDKPKGKQVRTTVDVTESGTVMRTETTEDSNKDNPPPGWCWI
jgi:dolichyl-phosphate-mannose-protein mannosyltransferase